MQARGVSFISSVCIAHRLGSLLYCDPPPVSRWAVQTYEGGLMSEGWKLLRDVIYVMAGALIIGLLGGAIGGV